MKKILLFSSLISLTFIISCDKKNKNIFNEITFSGLTKDSFINKMENKKIINFFIKDY
jgi:hypothetical protein